MSETQTQQGTELVIPGSNGEKYLTWLDGLIEFSEAQEVDQHKTRAYKELREFLVGGKDANENSERFAAILSWVVGIVSKFPQLRARFEALIATGVKIAQGDMVGADSVTH